MRWRTENDQHRLKVFGWGREHEAMTPDEETFALRTYQALFGVSAFETVPVPTLDALALRVPRLDPPASLAGICTAARRDRAVHAFGKSYQDLGLLNDYASAPDIVAYPRSERDVADVLDWATDANANVVPFGGGSSVVGGVTVRDARNVALVALDQSAGQGAGGGPGLPRGAHPGWGVRPGA